MPSQLLLSVGGAIAALLAFYLVKSIHQDLSSPLRHLPGPSSANPILGHFLLLQKNSNLTSKWRDQFGANFQFRGLFNTWKTKERDLFTADVAAIKHVFANDSVYQKGAVAQKIITSFLGNSLLAAEMDEHKRQRRILNPAFGYVQISHLTEAFNHKSSKLRDTWMQQIEADAGESRIDVLAWLRKVALDIIGEGGFHYRFDALDSKDQPNELEDALTRLFFSTQAQRAATIRLLQISVPILNIFPTPDGKTLHQARTTMLNIGRQLLADSKATANSGGGEHSILGRDLLSVLVKANMSKDIPEDQRLSDADVIAQVPTFLVAGHETTSTALTFALHVLSLKPMIQKKLRDELLTINSDNPTMDQLNSLPYLENFIRETMRLYSPVAYTIRIAMADDVIPLSKPYVDRNGKAYDNISVRAGTTIHIPIASVHRDKDLWGEDALEFKPERWDHLPEAVSTIPGVWANLLTFISGPHNCIGFRFSLVEMKSILFALLRTFEFSAAVPEEEIACTATPVLRPQVRSEPKGGSQLPLMVREYRAA